jgi:hypothetical protein
MSCPVIECGATNLRTATRLRILRVIMRIVSGRGYLHYHHSSRSLTVAKLKNTIRKLDITGTCIYSFTKHIC